MTQRIALTFDTEHSDRPTIPGGELRLLELLDRIGVRATFFLQGRWVEGYPSVARAIVEAGHLIGNHSHYHARMPLFTAGGFATDVRAAEVAIRSVTGRDPRPWFRFPFGTGANDPALRARLEALGYRHVGWDVDPNDWAVEATETSVAASLDAGIETAGDAAILLLHAWPTPTAGAVARLLPRLRDAGASFVTLDELEGEVRMSIPA